MSSRLCATAWSCFNILSPTAIAFPFLALARSHHLTGRPGSLTEHFSASESPFLLLFHPNLPSIFSPSLSLSLTSSSQSLSVVFFEASNVTLSLSLSLSGDPVKRVYISRTLSLRAKESLFNRLSTGRDRIPRRVSCELVLSTPSSLLILHCTISMVAHSYRLILWDLFNRHFVKVHFRSIQSYLGTAYWYSRASSLYNSLSFPFSCLYLCWEIT